MAARGAPAAHRRAPRTPPTVTTPETAAPPRSETPAARALLRVEAAPVPTCHSAALFDAVPAARPRLLWRAPGEAGMVAVGRAVRVAPRIDSGAGGTVAAVAGLGAAVGEELASLLTPGQAPPPGLRVLFTMAFDPSAAFGAGVRAERWRGFAPVEAFVPEILVRCSEAGEGEAVLAGSEEGLPRLRAELAEMVATAAATGCPRPAPEGDLVVEWAEGEHRANVVAALEALRRPGLSKVVLAHAVEVRRDRPFSPAALLDALGRSHPSCFLFALQPDPGAPVFLGASPERLVQVGPSVEGGAEDGRRRVLSGALAGSAPRGATPEEDEACGRRLLGSAKDLAEHAIVGEMIADALEPLCLRIDRGGEPVLEKLGNVQHLFTPISGALRPGRDLFDAVAALHPTPAVGGMPRERALDAIRELEREPRGLYAGVVGWADLSGRGDSAVAIRSALVDGERARVFAGGGIVPTSDPDVEVEETRLKMAAVLGALRAR